MLSSSVLINKNMGGNMFLLNAFSLQMLDEFPASVRIVEVSHLPEGLTSAIGHQDTANVLGVPKRIP